MISSSMGTPKKIKPCLMKSVSYNMPAAAILHCIYDGGVACVVVSVDKRLDKPG